MSVHCAGAQTNRTQQFDFNDMNVSACTASVTVQTQYFCKGGYMQFQPLQIYSERSSFNSPMPYAYIYIHSIHIVYIRKYVMWIVSRKSRKWFVCAMCWLRGALPWHDNVAWCTIVQVTTRSSNRQQSFIVHVARFCGLVWCAMGASPLKYCMSPCCLMLFLHHPFGVKLFSFRTFPYVRVQNMHLRLMKLPAL